MSSSTEKPNQKQEEATKAWIEKKATKESSKCPVCGHRQWMAADYLIRASTYSPGVAVMGGPSYVYAQITCANCGYTRLFNAVVMGLVPQGGKPDGEK